MYTHHSETQWTSSKAMRQMRERYWRMQLTTLGLSSASGEVKMMEMAPVSSTTMHSISEDLKHSTCETAVSLSK